MDQESFRKLLQTPRPGASNGGSRGSLLPTTGWGSSKPKPVDSSQPAFKPRKVKKPTTATSSGSGYRDRAAERRVGEGNDYAQVEAVLEDFERRTSQNEDKAAVEEQRRYLGGDSDHSILVKGLDVALLEQNKARAALSTEDDDSLELAFLEASGTNGAPPTRKKRTREDLIRELKEKREGKSTAEGVVDDKSDVKGTTRTAQEEARLLEEAKRAGKFKPIGFTPVVEKTKSKKKKLKSKGEAKDKDGDGERKKKKRKVEVEEGAGNKITEKSQGNREMLPPPIPVPIVKQTEPEPELEPEPEPVAEDFDIFAGAGEYEGIDLGDDDDEEEEGEMMAAAARPRHGRESEADREPGEKPGGEGEQLVPRGRWFATDEPETPKILPTISDIPDSLISNSRSPLRDDEADADAEEGEVEPSVITRLQPLQSSALPSIKDFLAMDEAAGQFDKRRKRKDKGAKGGGGGDGDGESKKMTAEVKAERDYKRLKSYQEKKEKKAGEPSKK